MSAIDLDLDAIEASFPVDCHVCGVTLDTFGGLYCEHNECEASGKPVPATAVRRVPPLVADLVRKVRDLTADTTALRAMLSRVVRHETTASHGHDVCGRWDASNGPRGHGGLPCTRCHTFADARTMLGVERWPTRQDDRETEEVCRRLEPCPCDNAACGCGARRPWFAPVVNKVPEDL